ncbi:MAG: hypothetical protein LBU09_03270 [Endomicrobium sp.]|jgi:hypothetical protein|nr:hypothetical protein [Endomicrobium sp.]
MKASAALLIKHFGAPGFELEGCRDVKGNVSRYCVQCQAQNEKCRVKEKFEKIGDK